MPNAKERKTVQKRCIESQFQEPLPGVQLRRTGVGDFATPQIVPKIVFHATPDCDSARQYHSGSTLLLHL